MIDTTIERLIPLREVPKVLPCRETGRRIHISAIYRWAQRGIHGVRLDVVRIGGTTYTSSEAIQRFGEQLSSRTGFNAVADLPTPRARQREIEQASRRVGELLGDAIPAQRPRRPPS